MPLSPNTLVRITARHAFRHDQTGRIDRQIVHSDPAKAEKIAKAKGAMWWVAFGGGGGAFWEGEMEEVKR